MAHIAIEQVLKRAALAKSDSDFTYFSDLLLAAEALAKSVTLGMCAAISDDKDRNRYRIEHGLARADGLGDWARAIDDILTGTSSQYLLTDAYGDQAQLARLSRPSDWQYESVAALKAALDALSISSEELPSRTDMKRWFRLLAVLRNKTKGHGAPKSSLFGEPAEALHQSISLFYLNFSIFERSWAYLYRNLSGKYRVSPISGSCSEYRILTSESVHSFPNGIFIWWGSPRFVPLLQSNPELENFYFANGNLGGKNYELLSYCTGDRINGDASEYSLPPGTLPASQTKGSGELMPIGNCLSNAPEPLTDYVDRADLEDDLVDLLLDDRRPIVTLRGKGGIGKTSLALRVLEDVYKTDRYVTVVWLSARDVDLEVTGPKAVRPDVISPEEIGDAYADLVLSAADRSKPEFDGRKFFEQQLAKCDSGPCLFILDNFETTQNPLEMFSWIDTFVRLPNKILITTRLREFKGDYPVDVIGMNEDEARLLISRTAKYLGIDALLTHAFTQELIHQSEGHPYVIKILLGEVAKDGRIGSVPRLIAGSDDILTALFERTYAALSPCAQRAFLTLAAWQSSVPRLALEAVLLRSTNERQEVESGVEMLIQYSLAEAHQAPADRQEFLALPLVASAFGRKKLNISPYSAAIESDVEILQMLGPSRRDDIRLGLSKKVERLFSRIASKVEQGASFEEFEPILDMICRNYPPGWLLFARWYLESEAMRNIEKAKNALRRFLETEPQGQQASDAWRQLAYACYRSGDKLGEVHAFIERARLANLPFNDVSNTANRLNAFIKDQAAQMGQGEKRALAARLLEVMESRRKEAEADDFSRMAWLAIHLGQDSKAHAYVQEGLEMDPNNRHCLKLAERFGVATC